MTKPIRAFFTHEQEHSSIEIKERVWILQFIFTDKYAGVSVIYCNEKTGVIGISNNPDAFSINMDFMNNSRP